MITNKVKVQLLSAFRELFNEDWRTIIYYGGRASGKSRSAAEALLIRGRQKKLRILCTREIQNTIKDSVHKLLKDLIEEHNYTDYEVTNDAIINHLTGTEFIFRGLHHNILEIKSLEGVDICWVEEAQTVTKASLDILVPTIRKPGSQIIYTFNRLNELDPVYASYCLNPRPDSYICKVNYDVLERAGLLPDVIKSEIEADRADPETFAHKWLGEPISQSELSIIGRTRILEAMQREIDDDGAIIVGADIARLGNDRIVFWMRKGLKTKKTKVMNKQRIPITCDQLEQFVDFDKEVELKVDDTGVGGGVTDEMMKRGYNVTAVNFGDSPHDKDKYPNWISEAWFNMSELITTVQLPYDSDLLMELSTRQWKMDNKGKRKVESKDDYKARGFRSPDLADACIICYSEPLTPGLLLFQQDRVDTMPEVAKRLFPADRMPDSTLR